MAEMPATNATSGYGDRSSATPLANRTTQVGDPPPLVASFRRKRSRAASARPSLTVSLVTPVRNEARNIAWALEQIADDVSEIVLVDRNSTDATLITARSCRPGIKVVPQEGIGKGSALGAGFLAATGDIIVTMERGRQHCEGPLDIVSAAWQPAEWVVRRWWAT